MLRFRLRSSTKKSANFDRTNSNPTISDCRKTSDPTISDSRKYSDPTISDSRKYSDPTISDSRKYSDPIIGIRRYPLSENVGNERIAPVSDYRYPVGSDCRILSDFIGSDRIRWASFDLGLSKIILRPLLISLAWLAWEKFLIFMFCLIKIISLHFLSLFYTVTMRKFTASKCVWNAVRKRVYMCLKLIFRNKINSFSYIQAVLLSSSHDSQLFLEVYEQSKW